MKIILLAASLAMSAVVIAAEGEPRVSKGKKFVHPGIFYTEGDFGRMRAMIAIFLDDKKLFDRVWNYRMGRPHCRPRSSIIRAVIQATTTTATVQRG